MVVDDEEDFTMVLKTVLEEEAYVVDTFNDPALALSGFEAGKYDLVITDIRMPTMNGFDLYRELKKVDRDVRICFLTAFEVYESDFQKLFPKVKVEGFLRKPGSISYLTSKIKEITG
jgi:CheY-like chemotaxis protein